MVAAALTGLLLALLALPSVASGVSCEDPRAVPPNVVSVSPDGPGAPIDSAIIVETTWSSWGDQGEVRLRDDGGSLVPVEVVAALPNLHVVQPLAPLEPEASYRVEWRPSQAGVAQIAAFETSASAGADAPMAPTLVSTRAHSAEYFATQSCGPYEDWVEVEIAEQDHLALLAVSGEAPPTSVDDALATTHGDTLRTEWQTWEPGAQLTLYLATLDPSGAFSGWEAAETIVMPPAGATSCATSPDAPAWGWLLLLPVLGRRRGAPRRHPTTVAGLALLLLFALPTPVLADTPTDTPSRTSTDLAGIAQGFGVAASVAGATCFVPAVATALRKPGSGELLGGCVGFAVPLTASALVSGGLARALRDAAGPSLSLHKRFAGTSALCFGLGVGMAIATLPSFLTIDFLVPGAPMSTTTATISATAFHLGVLHAALAERYDPRGSTVSRRRPLRIVPTPFGVAGVF